MKAMFLQVFTSLYGYTKVLFFQVGGTFFHSYSNSILSFIPWLYQTLHLK